MMYYKGNDVYFVTSNKDVILCFKGIDFCMCLSCMSISCMVFHATTPLIVS